MTPTPDILAALDVAQDLMEHENDCIRAKWQGGRSTADGGYESNYGGKWYRSAPVDETPKCDCGLDAAAATLAKVRPFLAAALEAADACYSCMTDQAISGLDRRSKAMVEFTAAYRTLALAGETEGVRE